MAVGHPIIFLFLAMSGTVAFGSSLDTGTTAEDPEPQFVGAIPNITAVAGSNVTLPCVVDSLGKYKVAWIDMDRNNVLTIKFHVITRNPRIRITYDRDRTWSLHILNVTEYDSGSYLCQVNTDPMKNSVGILEVVGTTAKDPEPHFIGDIPNITAVAGADVKLSCVVESLGDYKVAWIDMDRHNVLTIKFHVIKRNPRIRITYDRVRTWSLHISNVTESDSGSYSCQVNTNPMINSVAILEVLVAPTIRMPETVVRATLGMDVTLKCEVESKPKSVSYWTRDDRGIIIISNNKYSAALIDTGKHKVMMMLLIKNITTDDVGSYKCVADHLVGETEGTITIYVAPIIRMPETVVKATLGTNVTLKCEVESNPKSVTYWTRDDRGIIIISNNKYNVALIDTGNYKVQMKLIIKNLCANDFGSYRCIARNSAGETEGTITIYDPAPSYPSREDLESSTAASITQDLENGDSDKRDSTPTVGVVSGSDKVDGRGSWMWTTTLIKVVFRIIFYM